MARGNSGARNDDGARGEQWRSGEQRSHRQHPHERHSRWRQVPSRRCKLEPRLDADGRHDHDAAEVALAVGNGGLGDEVHDGEFGEELDG